MLRKMFLHLSVALLAMTAFSAFADPPARVGRVSFISGQVNFRADKDDEWTQATLNYPVTNHNGFATSLNSRLEIRVGSAAIRVDEDSEISIPRLDDEVIRVNVKRGVANVTVRSRESRYPIEVLTPAGKVTLNGTGTYRFEAGRDYDQTIITAYQGSASLNSDDNQVSVKEGREVVVDGIDPLQYSVREARRGPFEDWVFARDARIDRSRSARYVSPEIAGYEDLDDYGDWQDTPEYGTVWVPRETVSGWAPYRHGHWAWVDPWGWTWVDYAPWGFAPFHYGRWVYFNGYWGWAPGVIAPHPVYAPALVGFVGRPGWNVSFSFGTAPAVGWVPLGFHDIYRPAYPCSPTYVRNINITNINVRNVNVSNINWSNPPTPTYSLRKYPHAVTVVPQNAFAGGKPVMGQTARLTAPVSEPVIGTAPRIAAPVRRVVANEAPGQRRAVTGPTPSAVPPAGRQPAPEGQRKSGRGVEERAPAAAAGRAQPRVRTDAATPGREVKAPPVNKAHESPAQARRQPHRENDAPSPSRAEQPGQHPEQAAPRPRRIERPEGDRLVPQRESFDGRRRQPQAPTPARELHRETPPAPQPAVRPQPGPAQSNEENRGAGRHRAE